MLALVLQDDQQSAVVVRDSLDWGAVVIVAKSASYHLIEAPAQNKKLVSQRWRTKQNIKQLITSKIEMNKT